jgi:Co/Zn/Cd efflux system component
MDHIEAKRLRVREAEIMWKAMLITGIIFASQAIIMKYFIPSITLEGDTFHTASDFFINIGSFVIAFIAINARAAHTEMIRRRFAYIGIFVLMIGIVVVCIEAYGRFSSPVTIPNGWLMVTGFVGGLGNFWVHRILHSIPNHHQTHTHKVLSAHVMLDMLLSGVVVISALTAFTFDWRNADPVFSLLAAAVMVYIVKKLFTEIRHGNCSHGRT